MLRTFTSPAEVFEQLTTLRKAGKRVGLIPTMGALHEGHLSLVERAKKTCDVAIATIFVNPTQFGPKEDFSKYPRTLERDQELLQKVGCDFLFCPSADVIYPPGYSTAVEPPAVSIPLEGKCRPGHFRGVATIVLKLFQLLPSDQAFFGIKDYQQLQVIKRMVVDLNVPIEIVACPIVREADGLAMSSRNRYLSPAEREQALALSRGLRSAESLLASGTTEVGKLQRAILEELQNAHIERVDYVAIAHPETLSEVDRIDDGAVALIAAFVGTTRLIDNRVLVPTRV
ncbi:MAG: pantoate--beta-alanine ligase [Pirellulales bacterium]